MLLGNAISATSFCLALLSSGVYKRMRVCCEQHCEIHLHHNNPEVVSLLYRRCSVFCCTVIRGTLQPPAGLTSLFTSAWQIVCCVMETHCRIPPGAITVEETNLFHRKSVPSGPQPQRRPSGRWRSRGQLTMFKLGIPLWSIQDKCQNWYLVCTSSTSCLCQLMKQQEVMLSYGSFLLI